MFLDKYDCANAIKSRKAASRHHPHDADRLAARAVPEALVLPDKEEIIAGSEDSGSFPG